MGFRIQSFAFKVWSSGVRARRLGLSGLGIGFVSITRQRACPTDVEIEETRPQVLEFHSGIGLHSVSGLLGGFAGLSRIWLGLEQFDKGFRRAFAK